MSEGVGGGFGFPRSGLGRDDFFASARLALMRRVETALVSIVIPFRFHDTRRLCGGLCGRSWM